MRVRDPIGNALDLSAGVTFAVGVLPGVRRALEYLQTGKVFPGAVGGYGHPQHHQKNSDQLVQSFHSKDRYSTREHFTNSNWVAPANRPNANLGRFIGKTGKRFSREAISKRENPRAKIRNAARRDEA